MKYAKFSDTFLSDFRLDDNGETLVLTDKRGFTRAVRLLPYEERPKGEWVGNALDEHHCSRCGHPALWEEEPDNYYEVQSRFCPNCGADMQKGNVE